METRKGYVSFEFAIVALIFFLILLVFVANFEATIPGEVHKIRSTTACFRAELLADALLLFHGNATEWEKNTSQLTHLGFASEDTGALNYTKWVAAQSLTPSTVASLTNYNESIALRYSSYIVPNTLTLSQVESGAAMPQESMSIFFPNSSTVGIYARNAVSERTLFGDVEFFFPLANVTNNYTSFSSTTEGIDRVVLENVTNGSTAKVFFSLTNDSDQVHFNLTSSIDAVFIKKLRFRAAGQIYSRDYPIYWGLPEGADSTASCKANDCPKYGTLLQDAYGTQGILDASKNYCEAKRKMIMQNGTYKTGVDISIFAEG